MLVHTVDTLQLVAALIIGCLFGDHTEETEDAHDCALPVDYPQADSGDFRLLIVIILLIVDITLTAALLSLSHGQYIQNVSQRAARLLADYGRRTGNLATKGLQHLRELALRITPAELPMHFDDLQNFCQQVCGIEVTKPTAVLPILLDILKTPLSVFKTEKSKEKRNAEAEAVQDKIKVQKSEDEDEVGGIVMHGTEDFELVEKA